MPPAAVSNRPCLAVAAPVTPETCAQRAFEKPDKTEEAAVALRLTAEDVHALRKIWTQNWNNPAYGEAGAGIYFRTRIGPADLIMLDTNHDGGFENEAYRYFQRIGFKGLLFLDDIHLNPPMEAFWAQITEPKEDITDLGHWSGSGIVDFL